MPNSRSSSESSSKNGQAAGDKPGSSTAGFATENTFGRWKVGRASLRYLPSWKSAGKLKPNGDGQRDDEEAAAADGKPFKRSLSHSEAALSKRLHQVAQLAVGGGGGGGSGAPKSAAGAAVAGTKPTGAHYTAAATSAAAARPDQLVDLRAPPKPPRAEPMHRFSYTPACPTSDCGGGGEPTLTSKVMLLGDSGVGKTCLLVRFKDGKFLSGNFIATVGMDFRNKVLCVDGTKVKLQIWDTAGQERFRSVTNTYYREAHALLLIYDVMNRKTFYNTRAWLTEIREHAKHDVAMFLVGNKCDCNLEREVSKEEGKQMAEDYGVPFIETSAKDGENVERAFEAVARELLHRWRENPDQMSQAFDVNRFVDHETEKDQRRNSSLSRTRLCSCN